MQDLLFLFEKILLFLAFKNQYIIKLLIENEPLPLITNIKWSGKPTIADGGQETELLSYFMMLF
jgi:hypothetical protein